jgi:hypothetical protein
LEVSKNFEHFQARISNFQILANHCAGGWLMITASGVSHRWRFLKMPASIVFSIIYKIWNRGLNCSNFIETSQGIIKYLNLSIGGVFFVKEVLVRKVSSNRFIHLMSYRLFNPRVSFELTFSNANLFLWQNTSYT